jgi:hypothetical protein
MDCCGLLLHGGSRSVGLVGISAGMEADTIRTANRVAGRISPPVSHTIPLRRSYGGTGLTCGSAYGDSWQSTWTNQHSFSATMIAARGSACRPHRSGTRPPMVAFCLPS